MSEMQLVENEASVFIETRIWIPELLLHRAQWKLQVQLRSYQDHPEAPGSPNAAESRFPGTTQNPSGNKLFLSAAQTHQHQQTFY